MMFMVKIKEFVIYNKKYGNQLRLPYFLVNISFFVLNLYNKDRLLIKRRLKC